MVQWLWIVVAYLVTLLRVVLDRPAQRSAPSAGKHQLGQLTQEGSN
jgi:hypothetical protein